MFRRIAVALGAVALLASSQTAWAQTPTPVTAATASPDGSQRTDVLAKRVGGQRVERPDIYEGGVQIGTTASGAALLTFVTRGTCYVDPSASLGDGAETIVSCTATGAAAGDFVVGTIQDTNDVTDVYIKRAKAQTNEVHFSIGSYTAAQNPGTLTINFLVVR